MLSDSLGAGAFVKSGEVGKKQRRAFQLGIVCLRVREVRGFRLPHLSPIQHIEDSVFTGATYHAEFGENNGSAGSEIHVVPTIRLSAICITPRRPPIHDGHLDPS